LLGQEVLLQHGALEGCGTAVSPLSALIPVPSCLQSPSERPLLLLAALGSWCVIVDWAASCQGNCKCLGKKKRSPFGNVSSGTAHVVLVTKCLFFPVSQEPLPFLDCILYCFSLVVFLFFNPLCHCCVLLSSRGFDSEQIPDLAQDSYGCDICSVSSLCKMNFRELPNPLLTV